VFNLIRESLWFSYDGKYSYDYGIMNVNISNSGMVTEPFTANKKINEVAIKGNPKPYFQGVEYEPLEFDLELAFVDSFDSDKLRDVARWLCGKEYYKPLFFNENRERIFYCMTVDEPQLVHTGAGQGYIKVTMRCDSPYSYSPVFTESYTISGSATVGQLLKISNRGDLSCFPELWITKTGNGDFRIINTTNGGKEFKFTSLINGEVVYVDNEWNHIETSLANTYRYSNFNGNYLELVTGVNNLMIYGDGIIKFRYQFKTLQG
jgi:phage-related protein